MQCSAWPGNVSSHGGGNLLCFPDCARLVDPIHLLSQAEVLSGRHALGYFPLNPEWYTSTWTQNVWLAMQVSPKHMSATCKRGLVFCSQPPRPE